MTACVKSIYSQFFFLLDSISQVLITCPAGISEERLWLLVPVNPGYMFEISTKIFFSLIPVLQGDGYGVLDHNERSTTRVIRDV